MRRYVSSTERQLDSNSFASTDWAPHPEEIVRKFDLTARELAARAKPTGPLALRAQSDSVVLKRPAVRPLRGSPA